uniref:ceramide synthase 2-like n=1 Tax=Gasterosteus aculeatus aculeatus TaxID=481459 RepID=UPI001A99ED5A|nr:ceramide synthase 2-like [Gasterosteus aculeatus aculeatus]
MNVFAKTSQLHAALPCALCLLLVRYLFEASMCNRPLSQLCHTSCTRNVMLNACCCRYLATPLANVWGIRDNVRLTAEPNPLLENYFRCRARAPSQVDVRSLCKKTSWSERRVQVWFKRRRNQERPWLRKRFCEASWRCVFYTFAFVYGVLALYDKPWLYNLREVWAGFP